MAHGNAAHRNATTSGVDGEGNEGAEGQPIRVAVPGADPVVPEDIPNGSPKDHVDDPNNEGTHEGETRKKGRNSRHRGVTARDFENAEEKGQTRKASSYAIPGQKRGWMDRLKREQLTDWVEDKSGGQVMNRTGQKLSFAGDLTSVHV